MKKAAGEIPRGRGRPRSFDQEAALERAMVLFWERGYEATSLDELSAAMGISPSSLYATFGGKEQLFRAAVDRYLARGGGSMSCIFAKEPTARGGVQRLLETAAAELTRSDHPSGCMIALGGTQCSPGARPVQDLMRGHREAWHASLQARIQRGIEDGEIASDTDADALATFYSTVLLGMSVQARDGASRESLRAAVEAAMRAWPGASRAP
ncbi:TetR/AcrR family transcriptional regulator [Sorangium cellulosum]|uniref:TetR family transcriptional regulator n=1 Tax=Sorangium cellulosum TaxID=56 RepID=A0A150QFZ1_SORCE|nr:TetR/AcrR family transcriptional regulator [Sorangium cellulosum]KYF66802.1 TetR family transcriptional regulator [Sorangium cellulosum]